MEKIKNLYDGINFTTIPKVILEQLNQNGIRKSSISKRGKDGKFTTTYGDLLRPIFVTFYYNELNFCINEKYIGHLFELLDFGLCFDINNNVLNRNNIEVFYNEYSKGFNKGYNEFENNLKNNSNLFSSSNEQISYKIYSRIKEHWTENKDGSIILNANDIKINDKITFLLTESNFFKSGVNGGEFYKAWEIILNNPTVFEPIFTKYSDVKTNQPQQPEPEPLDLSDSNISEKIALLYELGIIDYLHKKDGKPHTVNSIATVLSGITGIKAKTIQSAINPFINTVSTSKGTPAKSTLTKAKEKIIDLGF